MGGCLRAGRRSCSTATDRESNSDSDDDGGGGGNLRRRVSRCFRTPRSLARGLVDEEGPIARERRTERDGTTTLNCWRYGGTEMTRFATHGENCAERESHVVILATATVFRIMTRHAVYLLVTRTRACAGVWPMSSAAEIGRSLMRRVRFWDAAKSVPMRCDTLNCACDPGPFAPFGETDVGGTAHTTRSEQHTGRRSRHILYGWLSTYIYPIYTLDDTNIFLQSDDDDFRCVQIEQTYKSHIVQ